MYYTIYFAALGAFVGSFLAWLGRSVMDRPNARPRSTCDACRRKLAWWELIPVFSYIGLGGQCHSCGNAILVEDWMMEVIGAILFGLGAIRFTSSRDLLWWCILAFATLLLFYIELRWSVVPRGYSVLVALLALFAASSSVAVMPMVMLSALLGTIFYFFLYTISRGSWVGDGDIALGFVIGAAVGFPTYLGLTLVIAHVLGACVALIMLGLKKRQLHETLPMGAFLLPAMWVVVLWFRWIF
ncbi:MAG: prepilin peptidase [Candidatus Magasanikbacteria bacterium]|nr:prepilin peptidase [Candidatus Magasanikbacteria bacterium]